MAEYQDKLISILVDRIEQDRKNLINVTWERDYYKERLQKYIEKYGEVEASGDAV